MLGLCQICSIINQHSGSLRSNQILPSVHHQSCKPLKAEQCRCLHLTWNEKDPSKFSFSCRKMEFCSSLSWIVEQTRKEEQIKGKLWVPLLSTQILHSSVQGWLSKHTTLTFPLSFHIWLFASFFLFPKGKKKFFTHS